MYFGMNKSRESIIIIFFINKKVFFFLKKEGKFILYLYMFLHFNFLQKKKWKNTNGLIRLVILLKIRQFENWKSRLTSI